MTSHSPWRSRSSVTRAPLRVPRGLHRFRACQLRSNDRAGDRASANRLLERQIRVQALDEGCDEGVAGAEPVDDFDRMTRHVDLATFVEEQHTALAALEHERADAELEQR